MKMKKELIPLFSVYLLSVIIFSIIFSFRKNYEFLIYIGVIIFFGILIYFTYEKTKFPNFVLWGLLIWAMLHMSGGGLSIFGKRLYEIMLIPIVGEPYNILKFDQFVHIVGFMVATWAFYYILKPKLSLKGRWVALSIVLVMAGLGAGALNEIIEFAATVITPETGVGGYINTSLDMVSNLIGAIIGMIVIYHKEK